MRRKRRKREGDAAAAEHTATYMDRGRVLHLCSSTCSRSTFVNDNDGGSADQGAEGTEDKNRPDEAQGHDKAEKKKE